MSRLPIPGGDNNNWGTVLNDYLQQSLATDGTLLTTATNSYTTNTNTNLATGSRPGLVQLAGDISNTYSSPSVVGLQGRAVSSSAPTDGYVLTWSASNSQWQPASVSGSGVSRAQAMAFSSMRV
ncbi:MAG TPA: hypothetical protein VIH90_02800 [Candidatus Saccharimonadales bacterium]